jgi:hypothetical protein
VIKVYQLLAHGWWFSLCTPASSTTKTGHRDIAEILLKVALNTINQSINQEIYLKELKKPVWFMKFILKKSCESLFCSRDLSQKIKKVI